MPDNNKLPVELTFIPEPTILSTEIFGAVKLPIEVIVVPVILPKLALPVNEVLPVTVSVPMVAIPVVVTLPPVTLPVAVTNVSIVTLP